MHGDGDSDGDKQRRQLWAKSAEAALKNIIIIIIICNLKRLRGVELHPSPDEGDICILILHSDYEQYFLLCFAFLPTLHVEGVS